MMDTSDLLALYDTQLRIEIEYPGLRREALPRLVRFIRPAPGMNFISYSRLEPAELEPVIREQVAYFAPMGQPFSWHVYDHDSPPALAEHLKTNNFTTDEDDPEAVMVLELETVPPALLKPVKEDIRPVGRDRLDDIVQVETQVWGGDFGWLKERLGAHLEIPGYLSIHAAYVDGQPACSGWTCFHPHSQFAGLFGGATLAGRRGRGLYTAILAVRVQEAIRRGYRFLAVGASSMSRPILARNGFRLLTYEHDYVWNAPQETASDS